MKWFLYLTCVLACLVAVSYVWGELPTVSSTNPTVPSLADLTVSATPQYDWVLLRTVTASDTPLTVTTRAWTTIKTKFLRIPYGYNRVRIAVYADGDGSAEGDPNGGTFAWRLYTCSRNSTAQLQGNGTWAIGELALSHNPALGTETALTYNTTDPNSSKWGELPVISANTGRDIVAYGTTDDIGELEIDVAGEYGAYLEITSLSNITNLYVLCKGY